MTKNVLMTDLRVQLKSLASLRAWFLCSIMMLSVAGMKAQTPYAIWCEGNSTLYFTNSNETLAANDTYDSQTITAVWSGDAVTNVGDQSPQWTATAESTCTKVVFDQSFQSVKPTSLYNWFYNMKKLTTIEGLQYLNTSEATTMRWMFSNCQSLASLDLSHFDTRKVTNMNSMFSACLTLTTLDLRSFDISKVTTMQQMFQSCSNLTTILANDDWSALNREPTSDNMFDGCTSLKGGNGTEYNIGYRSISRARPDGGADAPGYFTSQKAIYVVWCEDNKTLYFTYDDSRCVIYGTHNGNTVTKYWTDDNGGSLFDTSSNHRPLWSLYTVNNTIGRECQSVVIESYFEDVRPTRTNDWFYHFEKTTSISGLQYLNTSEVTDMFEMFYGCSSLTSLDLSKFDTKNVTDMRGMFEGCSSLTSLDLSKFDTKNVTGMSGMFRACTSLTSLNLSKFDTQNVSEMKEMFAFCWNLQNLDLSTFDTGRVNDMTQMFLDCKSLESLNLKNFKPTNNYDGMFNGCAKLRTIYCDNDWNNNGASSTEMFKGCVSLVGASYTTYDEAHTGDGYARIDSPETPGYFSKDRTPFALWNPDNKTLYFTYPSINDENSSYSGLANVNKWFGEEFADTENHPAGWVIESTTETGDVEYQSINSECEHVVFDPSFEGVMLSSLSHWFDGMTNLKDITGLLYLNTPEAKHATCVFAGCSNLTELNLRNFYLGNVDNTSKMFYGCEKLKTIYSNLDWDNNNVQNSSDMFTGCISLVGGNGTAYDEAHTDIEYAKIDRNDKPGYFSRSADPLYFIWCNDNKTIYLTYTTDKVYNEGDTYNGHTISRVYNMKELPNNLLNYPDYQQYCTTVVIDESMSNVKPTDLSHFFKDCKALTNIEGLQNLNTSEVTSMAGMFDGCKNLGNADVSHFDTRKVTDMSFMFHGCEGLRSIYGLRMLNTSNVTTMEGMFENCSSLTELDLNNFDTGKVTDMTGMFRGCSNLLNIYCDNDWKREGVEIESTEMFLGCSTLYNYDSSKIDINYAHPFTEENFGYFYGGYNHPEFSAIWCEDNATLYFASEDKFYSKGDTYNGHTITNVWTALEVYKDETGDDMDYPRWNSDQFAADRIAGKCKHVVFESNISAARPERTSGWFAGFSLLTSVDGIENLNTSEVVNMAEMFKGCSKLTSLDLSNFTAIEVFEMDMHEMFSGCSNLTSVDLSNFNSENVKDMSKMFYNCTELKTVDLTNFRNTKTRNVTQIFYGCINLTTIYCDYNWNGSYVNAADHMFVGCNYLVGGNGTKFKGNESGIEYARPDRGSLEEGYFTKVSATPYVIWCEDNATLYFANEDKSYRKGDTYNGHTITNVWTDIEVYKDETGGDMDYPRWNSDLFADDRIAEKCEKVVFEPNFSAARPERTRGWFAGFSLLTSVEGIENLNTSEVVNMAEMFKDCPNLTSLDLSSFTAIEGIEMDMHEMFSGCYNLTNVDLSNFNSEYVTDMHEMFSGCTRLKTVGLTNFRNTKTWNVAKIFYACMNLTTIYCNYDWNNYPMYVNYDKMFFGCVNLVGGAGTTFKGDESGIGLACPDRGSLDEGYFTTASATPYVIWCESTNTLYFTNPHFDEYAVGDYFGDIDGQTITALWSGDQVTNSGFTPLWFKDETSTSMNQNCKKVVIDKSFQEVKPTSLDLWFAQLDNVEEIQGLQYLNTSEATSMAGMFNSCGIEGGMKTLDVSHFDTGKVTDMQLMFSHCGVTSLDLNSFDVSHVTNFENMFINCSELTTIYCKNDWSAKAPRTAKSTNMFSGCSKLKGSNGTSFSEDHMNIEYARLDAEGTPGYFTFENDEKTYDLTISEAMVGTLYLDFPVVIPNEDYFNVYYVKSIDAEGTLHLKEIYDVIPANTATIIFANAGTYTMMKTDNEGETITGNLLKGVTEATSVADLQAQHGTDIYVLSRGQNSYIGFRIAGGAVKTIPANRAYLPYTSSGNAQELSISFEEEDVTGISDIAGHANSGETKIYNLSGQRVKNPQRGIYIVNGKKVYIR